MEDLGIQVKAVLTVDTTASVKNINDDISKKVQGQIESCKISLEVDDNKIADITKKINNMIASFDKIGNANVGNNIGEKVAKEQKTAQTAIQNTINLEKDWIKQRRNYDSSGTLTSQSTTYKLNDFTTRTINQSKGETNSIAEVEDKLKSLTMQEKEQLKVQADYLGRIKSEYSTIVSLKKKISSSYVGENETAEMEHQVKLAQGRISYDTKQLEKKKLLSNEIKSQIEDYKKGVTIQDKYNDAKSKDNAIKQTEKELEFQNKLNISTEKYIQQLNSIQSKALDPNSTKAITNTTDINGVNTAYQEVITLVNKLGNSTTETFARNEADVKNAISIMNQYISQLQEAEYAANQLRTKSVGEIKIEQTSGLNILENDMKSAGVYAGELVDKVSNLRVLLENVSGKESLTGYNIELSATVAKFKELKSNASLQLKTENAEKSMQTLQSNIQSVLNRLQTWKQENPKAMKSFGVAIDEADKKLRGLLGDLSVENVSQTNKSLQGVNAQLKEIKSNAVATGNAGKSLFAIFKEKAIKFAGWYGIVGVLMTAKRVIAGMVSEVVTLDTAMTNLYKVTNNTAQEYTSFFTNAKNTAQELAVSLSDIINSTADFARLGYSLPDSTELAKVAALYVNVGDGITADEASSSIISTMKAFNIEATNAETIIDKFNQVGNNFAISSAGIGDALQRSASALATANNDLSQSIALQVGTNNVVQNPETVGNMWKTVSMRIRGAKTELEEAGEDTDGLITSTSTLQSLIKGMTKFDILEDDGQTFKSTYDIIVGIGKEWDNLTDVNKASLLEALAGKRQGNALSAALANIKDIEKAYQSAEDSAGSAVKENETYQKSAAARISKFKEMTENLSSSLLSGDDIGNVVDIGTKGLKLLDGYVSKFGALNGIIVPLISTVLTFKGKGISEGIMTSLFSDISVKNAQQYVDLTKSAQGQTELLNQSYKSLSASEKIMAQNAIASSSAVNALTMSQRASAVASKAMGIALKTALNIGVMLLISAAIEGIYKLANAQDESAQKAEENAQKAKEAAQENKENLSTIRDLANQYKQLNSQTTLTSEQKESLSDIQTQLISKFGLEADAIDLLNGKYDENIAKIDETIAKQQKIVNQGIIEEYADAKYASDNNVQNDLYYGIDMNSNGSQVRYAYSEAVYQKLKNIQGVVFEDDDVYNPFISGDLISSEKVDTITEMIEQIQTLPSNIKGSKFYEELFNRLSGLRDKYLAEVESTQTVMQQAIQQTYNGIDYKDLSLENFDAWASGLRDAFKNSDELTADLEPEIQALYKGLNQAAEVVSSTFSFSDYASQYDEVIEKVNELKDAYDKVSNGTMSDSEFSEFFSSYPDLLQYANNTDKLKSKIEELAQASPETLITSLETLRDNLTNTSQIKACDNLINKLKQVGDLSTDITTLNDALKEQKEILENIEDTYETTVDVAEEFCDSQIETLDNQKSDIEDYYQTQIDSLQSASEEIENQNDLQEKQADILEKQNDLLKAKQKLENAKNNLSVVSYSESRGFYREANQNDVNDAKEEVESAKKNLSDSEDTLSSTIRQNNIDKLTEQKEQAVANIDEEVAKWEEYKAKWSDVVDSYETETRRKIAAQVLGTNYETDLTNKSNDALNNFASNYNSYKDQIISTEQSLADAEGEIYAARGKELEIYQAQLDKINKVIESINAQSTQGTETDNGGNAWSNMVQNAMTKLETAINKIWNNNSVANTSTQVINFNGDIKAENVDSFISYFNKVSEQLKINSKK